ncbi:MAG: ComEC/Rec2 family competence protein [Nitrospirales bacterium]
MFDDYVRVDTTPLYKHSSGSAKVCHLLWGDGVRFDGGSGNGSRRRVKARGGRPGWISASALGGPSLLEIYVIDVGQGDGILIKTPNFRHVLIDGGFPRSRQDTGKNAADFVDWKFVKDYGQDTISLDAMLASHCDADHYGGLADLLDVTQNHELDAQGVTVDAFYHAGLSWWKKSGGGKHLGQSRTVEGEKFWTQLLGDRQHAVEVTADSSGDQLHGWWHDFIRQVVAARTRSGQPTPIARLSHRDVYLPRFGPNSDGEPAIRILGPVEFDIQGMAGLRRFSGGDSQNTNGISLLLRVDFGRTRILFTGDLNKVSQRALLEDYTGERTEFLCDVAKACHHGSEDVSYQFLQAMQPAATVISSGDNEGYDHPRPSIIAASATTGYVQLDADDDDLLTPLIYSTELGRSVDLGFPKKLEVKDASGNVLETLSGQALDRSTLHMTKTKRKAIRMGTAMVVGGLVYGLVNVRTDGNKILCATLDESDATWRINTFLSRF